MSPYSLSLLASVSPKMHTLLSFSSSHSPHLPNHNITKSNNKLSHSINGLSSCPSSPLLPSATKSSPFLISTSKIASFRVLAASSIPDARSDEPAKTSDFLKTLQLGAMFATWYLLNIYYNIYNKQVRSTYSFSSTPTIWRQKQDSIFAIISIWGESVGRQKLLGAQDHHTFHQSI